MLNLLLLLISSLSYAKMPLPLEKIFWKRHKSINEQILSNKQEYGQFIKTIEEESDSNNQYKIVYSGEKAEYLRLSITSNQKVIEQEYLPQKGKMKFKLSQCPKNLPHIHINELDKCYLSNNFPNRVLILLGSFKFGFNKIIPKRIYQHYKKNFAMLPTMLELDLKTNNYKIYYP